MPGDLFVAFLFFRVDVRVDDDLLALVERALDAVTGAVLLRLFARDHVRTPELRRGHGHERHRAERHAGELRVRVREPVGERLADERERVRVSLEEVLVDVVVAGTAV